MPVIWTAGFVVSTSIHQSGASLAAGGAPVVLMPHGAGYGKYPVRWAAPGLPAPRHAHGAERQQLVYHGRVVPAAILLAHPGRLAVSADRRAR